MLIKTQSQSRTEQFADLFAQRIRTRLLAQGERLPSALSRQLGDSGSTNTDCSLKVRGLKVLDF